MKFLYEGITKELNIKGVNLYEEWRKEKIHSIIRVSDKFIVNLKQIDSFFGEEVYQTIIIKEN